jgi:hypothetical protein
MNVGGVTIAWITLVLAASICSAEDQVSPSPIFDQKTFENMPETDRLDFVKALLRTREAQLQNFSYHIAETSGNIDLDSGDREEFPKANYSVRRLGQANWMRLEQPGRGANHGFDSIMNWDGKRSKALTQHESLSEMEGVIKDNENSNFRYRAYNQILGFRVLEDGAPMTVVDWISQFPNQFNKLATSIDVREGVILLKVNVYEESRHKAFWFDPSRGLMAVRTEYLYQVPKGYNKEYSDVLDSTQVSGVWVPTKVLRRTGTSVSRKETEIIYSVTDFKIGTVKAADIEIVYPPGTRVIDQIEKVSYVVQPDGTQKPMSFYDVGTGTVRTPNSDANLKAVTSNLYKTPEQVPAPQEQTYPVLSKTDIMPQNGWNYWVLAIGGALLLGLFVIVVLRRRNMI